MGRLFVIILFLFLIFINICLASEIENYSLRERIIILTLNELEMKKKERIFNEAFIEAVMRLKEEQEAFADIKKEDELWQKILQNLEYLVTHTIEYNDNLYCFRDKISDIVNRIEPNVKLKFIDMMATVDFELGIRANLYARNSGNNNQDMHFNFNIERKLGRYSIFFKNNFLRENISPSSLGIEQRKFPRYWEDIFNMGLRRKFNRLYWDFNYYFVFHNFESEYSYERDYTIHQFGASSNFLIAPKTEIFTGIWYGFVKHKYDSAGDSNFKGFNFGLKGWYTPKLSGSIEIGYNYQDYETAPDFKSVVTDTNIHYGLSELTRLDFNLQRRTEESNYSEEDYNIFNKFGTILTHNFALSPPYFFIQFGMAVSYLDFPKLIDNAGHERFLDFNLSLGYKLRKWFEFVLGYIYKSRKSNLYYDYNNNIFTFTTKALF
ncbi:MAG: outer membrane beta-barrel protein [Candidatus Omnitrophica bacterium]|nr:outer membrane beta-barrel protein [Candidatus Omnitrophota bacterium]